MIASFWLINKHLQWYTNVSSINSEPDHLLSAFSFRNVNNDVSFTHQLVSPCFDLFPTRYCAHLVHGAYICDHQLCLVSLLGTQFTAHSFLSYPDHERQNHSTPLLLLRDCYESTVLTSFFYLLLTYISPDPAEQREIFRKVCESRSLFLPLSSTYVQKELTNILCL